MTRLNFSLVVMALGGAVGVAYVSPWLLIVPSAAALIGVLIYAVTHELLGLRGRR